MIKVISILSLLILVAYYVHYRVEPVEQDTRVTNTEFRKGFAKVTNAIPVRAEKEIIQRTVQSLELPGNILERISLSEKEKSLLQALIIHTEWDKRVAAILILSRFMNLIEVVNYVRQLKLEIKNNPTESLKSIQLAWNNLQEGDFLVDRANCILLANDLNVDRAIVNKFALDELLNSRNVQELINNNPTGVVDDAVDAVDSEQEHLVASNECAFKKIYAVYLQSSLDDPDEVLDGAVKILEMHENRVLKNYLIKSFQVAFPYQQKKLWQILRHES